MTCAPEDLTLEHPEIWRPVVGYEGLYEISSHGRLRALERDTISRSGVSRRFPAKVIAPRRDIDGYLRPGLWRQGRSRRFQIHALVAAAFVGPRPDIPHCQVRHLNCDHNANWPKNLRYGTPQDNRDDSMRLGRIRRGERCSWAVLIERDAAAILALRAIGLGYRRVSRALGVSESAVSAVGYSNWRHVQPLAIDEARSWWSGVLS